MFEPRTRQRRRSIRLPGYDYSRAGAYFLTICTHNRESLLGEVVDGAVRLNRVGEIVVEEWARTEELRQEIALDEFVVMPNHFHAIVWIAGQRTSGEARGVERRETGPPTTAGCGEKEPPVACWGFVDPLPCVGPRPKSIGSLVAGFKSAVTRRIKELDPATAVRLWQRNFYDHVIRDEAALTAIRRYIQDNPARWAEDPDNPENRADSHVAHRASGSDNR